MRESPDSLSDGMFVADKEWNTAYIHIHVHLMLSMSVSVCNKLGRKVSKSNYIRKANPTYLNH